MEQQNVQSNTGERRVFREILYVLKKNIILLLIIIFAVTAVGGIYAFLRKPKYIATEQLLFSMGDRAYIADDMNTMNAYKATIQSFANQGVVVDRANHYAKLYYTLTLSEDEFNAAKGQANQQNSDNVLALSFPSSLTYQGYKDILLDILTIQVEMVEDIVLSYNEEISVWNKTIEKLEIFSDMVGGDSIMIKENDQARKVLHQQAVVLNEMRILSTMIYQSELQELIYRQAIKDGKDSEQIAKDRAELVKVKSKQDKLKKLLSEDQKTLSNLLEMEPLPIDGIPYRFDEYDTLEKIATALGQPVTGNPEHTDSKFLMYEKVEEIQNICTNVQTEKANFIKKCGDYIYDANSEEGMANAGKEEYIQTGLIGILATDTEEKSFVFGISYTDGTDKLAKEKVKLLTLAYNIESSYFFTNVKANIDDLGLKSCVADMSKITIILLAFCIGIVVALIVVYLIYVLDKTVKSREDAEKIARCPVLACIEPQEVKKNGK